MPQVKERVKESSEIRITRAVKDAVREKHQLRYRLKRDENRKNYRRSCKN